MMMKTIDSIASFASQVRVLGQVGLMLALGTTALAQNPTPAPNTGNDNPTGNSGLYNSTVTTAGLYNAYTGNALRQVSDLVEPGAAGSYGLVWSRVSTSRYVPISGEPGPFGEGGSWHHSFQWRLILPDPSDVPQVYTIHYPDGGVVEFSSANQSLVDPTNNNATVTDSYLRGPKGVQDRFNPSNMRLLMSDGGAVTFAMTGGGGYRAASIDDPYHARTLLTYDTDGKLATITEPGGRSLTINFIPVSFPSADGTATATATVIGSVTTSDNQTVSYSYVGYGGGQGIVPYINLSTVTYVPAIGSQAAIQATYTYTDSNDGTMARPLLLTANDPHFAGPLAQLRRAYKSGANYGVLQAEISAVTGTTVDTFDLGSGADGRTEVRGDDPEGGALPSRNFDYDYGDYQVSAVTDFQGLKTVYAYDPNKNVNKVTDRRNNSTQYVNEPILGKTKSLTRPDGSTESFEYGTDPFNPYFLTKRTNERGLSTLFTRDPNTNLITNIAYPDGSSESFTYKEFSLNGSTFHKLKTHTTKKGAVITYSYDQPQAGGSGNLGLVTSVKSPKDTDNSVTVVTQFNYDGLDRVTKIIDARQNSTTFSYTYRHLLLGTGYADGTSMSYGYDAYGNQTSKTDELGHLWSWTYDEHRRPLTMTLPATTGLAARIFRYSYEHGSSPGASHTQRAKATVQFPSNKIIKRTFRNNGWLAKMVVAQNTPDQSITTYGYNEIGQIHTSTQVGFDLDGGDRVTTTDYDNRNRVQDVVDNLGHVTAYTYYPAGDPQDGLLHTIQRADGRVITYLQYDQMGRQQSSQDAAGNVTNNAYDAAGNPLSIKDPNGNQSTYAYDLLNRMQSLTFADQTKESYAYDELGNLTKFINRNGDTQTFRAYDQRNRMTGFDWSDGNTPSVTETYFGNGLPKQKSNGNSTLSYVYDEANELLSETQSLAGAPSASVGYQPDVDGFNTQTIYPSGYTTTYHSTNRDQVSDFAVFSPSAPYSVAGGSFTYYKDGMMSDRSLSNSTYTDILEDNVGRIVETNNYQADDNDGGIHNNYAISDRKYGYDPVGRLNWWEEEASTTSPGHSSAVGTNTTAPSPLGDAYIYNAADRLKNAYQQASNVSGGAPDAHGDSAANLNPTNPAETHRYDYDMAGSRTQTVDNGVTVTYGAVNNLNQYSYVGNSERSCSYDFNGNLLSNGVWTYTYDAQNRMTSASNRGNRGQANSINSKAGQPSRVPGPTYTYYVVVLFAYDASDRCINRTFQTYRTDGINTSLTQSTSANLYYSSWNLLEERDAANPSVMAKLYVYGMNGSMGAPTMSLDAAGNQAFYHTDARGYVTHLTDADGSLIESVLYDAFGTPQVTDYTGTMASPSHSEFLFAGQLYLSDLGLYDMRHRMYDPGTGRFLQADPLRFGGGDTNIYTYCANDPVNHADPSGLVYDPPINYIDVGGGGGSSGSGIAGSYDPGDFGTGSNIPGYSSGGGAANGGFSYSPAGAVGISGYAGGGGSGYGGGESWYDNATSGMATAAPAATAANDSPAPPYVGAGTGGYPVYSPDQNYPTNPIVVEGLDLAAVALGVVGNAIGFAVGAVDTVLGLLSFDSQRIGEGLGLFGASFVPRYGLFGGPAWGISTTYIGLGPLLIPTDVGAYGHDVGYNSVKGGDVPTATWNQVTSDANTYLNNTANSAPVGIFGTLYNLGIGAFIPPNQPGYLGHGH